MSADQWEKFGEEIRKTVQDAVESQNFEKLNQAISEKIGQAADTVAQGVKNAADGVGRKYHGYKTYTTQQDGMPEREQAPGAGMRYTNGQTAANPKPGKFPGKAPSAAGAAAMMLCGYTLAAIEIVWFMLMLAATFFPAMKFGILPRLLTGTLGALAVPLAAFGIWLSVRGTVKFARIGRFKEYAAAIGQREYCNISELAGNVRKSVKTVVKDLEYMIGKRWFSQGHLDRQKTCLIVTNEMYGQYCRLEEQKTQQRREEAARKEKAGKAEEALPPELREAVAQGEEYMMKLRRCNDEIPGEEISEKISRIEVLTGRIFERVRQNPASVGDIHKLMEYYLPTTVKLLEAYAQMDAQPVGGENIRAAKKEIEDTLDTLNEAFEKILDSLFQETAWDVSADISVLNTMLAQEGLKEDGLKKNR